MHFFHPQNTVTSIGWGGQQFEPDANGVFDLPEAAAADMAAFGLVPGDPAPPEPVNVQVPVSQWSNADLLAKAAELNLEMPADIKRPALIQVVASALKPQA